MIKPISDIERHLDCCDDEAIRFDGLDDAVIGTDHDGNLVYEYEIMIRLFVEQGMTEEEAEEWINFNVIGTNGGYGFTILFL
jgi:hypothetical protein